MEELILPIVLALIKREPEIQDALVKLFNGTQPTAADWQAAHDSAATETFASLAPAAAANLPPESDAATVTQSGPVTPAESQPDAPKLTMIDGVLTGVTETKEPEAEAATVAAVVCPKCQQPLVSNSPDNCNC